MYTYKAYPHWLSHKAPRWIPHHFFQSLKPLNNAFLFKCIWGMFDMLHCSRKVKSAYRASSVYAHRQDSYVRSHSSKEDEIVRSDSVPAQMHGVWLWWSCIKRQHLSLWAFYWRSFYIHRNGELKRYHTFTSVIPPSLLRMHLYTCTGCTHISVWQIPTHSSSSSDTTLILLLEKDCKFLLVTLTVNKSAF